MNTEITVADIEAHDAALYDASFIVMTELRRELQPFLVESLVVELIARHGSADPAAFTAKLSERVIKRVAAGENGRLAPVMLKPVFEGCVTGRMSDQIPYPHITVANSITGWHAVQMHWNNDLGGFAEPWSTGGGKYATAELARVEARAWAESEGLPFYE